MGIRDIAKVEVVRDLEEVFILIRGRTPDRAESRKAWFRSPGNRYARLAPSQARQVAYRLIQAASKVERKLDKYSFWTGRSE